MKKYFTLLCVVLLSTWYGNAQYRCIPSIQLANAPGGYTGTDFNLSYYWHDYLQDTVAAWFPVHPLNFPFYFNGQRVKYFKVSNTGVLTFDTTTVTAPRFMHPALPSASVPNQSVCVEGIRVSEIYVTMGSVDQPEYPQKQWITFFTATDSARHSQTMWSIVLEDSTNNIYIVDHYNANGFASPLTLGLQVNATTAYPVPGPANIVDPGNTINGPNHFSVYYTFTPGHNLASDGTVTASELPDYNAVSRAPFTLNALFRNLGTDTVKSLQLHYTINGGAAVNQAFTGLNLPSGYERWLTFSTPFTPQTAGTYVINTYADNLSTGPDQDATNNHFIQTVYIADTLPKLRPLFEEFKGTWCDNSGYWTKKYDTLLHHNANGASSIKYESYNGLLTWDLSDYDERAYVYDINFVPGSVANGLLAPQPDLAVVNYYDYVGNPWNVTQQMIDSLEALSGLFYIQPVLYRNGHFVQGTVTAKAALSLPANAACRLFAALVEDTILQPYETYNSYETLFVNTTRKIFPDANGVDIGHPAYGHTDTLSFAYNVTDTACHLTHLHLVAFIQDMNTLQILQSAEVPEQLFNLPVPPMPLITGDTLYCNGTHATMAVTDTCTGCRYNWSNGATGLSITVSTGGLYTVTAVNANGATSSNSFRLTGIDPPGVPVIEGDSFLCQGVLSEMLSISNICEGCSYYWQSPFIYSNATEYEYAPGTDTVYVVNMCGINKNTFTIFGIVPAPTTPQLIGDSTACPSQPARLIVTNPCNGCRYVWSNNETGDSITVTTGGSYVVSATNGCASYPSAHFVVTGGIPSAPLITGNNVLCGASQVTLTVSNTCSGCTYTWNDQSTLSYLNVNTPGYYSVQITNLCGNSAADSIYVYGSLPQPRIERTGNTFTASDSDVVSFQWYLNDTTLLSGDTLATLAPPVTGYYSVKATSSSGCSDTSARVFYNATAIQNVSLNEVKVYPTVTTGNLIIDLGTGVADVHYVITSLNGDVISSGLIPVAAGKYTIGLSQVSSGVYFINLRNQAGTATFKIIKISQ